MIFPALVQSSTLPYDIDPTIPPTLLLPETSIVSSSSSPLFVQFLIVEEEYPAIPPTLLFPVIVVFHSVIEM